MDIFRFIVSILFMSLASLVAFLDIAGMTAAFIRARRGIPGGFSNIAGASLFFSFVSWLTGYDTIGFWAFVPAALDPGTLSIVSLPFIILAYLWHKGSMSNPENSMKSLADELPSEIAKQIHPDWRKNEAGYWAARDKLLTQYEGKWIGFADGAVIASGTSPVAVFHAAEESGRHPFVICVGREDEPCRMRRLSFPYDGSYPGEPLPILPVEFRTASGSSGKMLDNVIADTGADASALPWADCLHIKLNPALGRPGTIGGVAGGTAPTRFFRIWVEIDGQEYACRLHADFSGSERILGRDVLNRLEILFRGPSSELIVSP